MVSKHLDIPFRLLVVDCCRPQKTKLVNPEVKFPIEIFEQKVQRIKDIASKLKGDGYVTDIYFIFPNDPLIKELSKKYLRGIYDCTHSGGGTANMSYWAALELPKTQYVIHYDGDLLLYQRPGYSWVEDALGYFDKHDNVLTVLPRFSPPIDGQNDKIPSNFEPSPNINYDNYWLNSFFSTRHFLIDKERLAPLLPILSGKILLEKIVRKYTNRVFPRDPEIVLFKRLSELGINRLILKSCDAWFLHPNDKPADYIKLLPKIIELVDKGIVPESQKGYANIQLEAWKTELTN